MQPQILNGRYELESKLGEGGMATVYLGRDLRLNRQVALKVLLSQFASDPDFLGRFQHEAEAVATLNHPNIVRVYDVGQDGDLHYIVMEYVEGGNLKVLINRQAPLPIAQAVTLTTEIAHGLQAAHQMGLVHRDIKPQNIMVTPAGQVKITDFGIAKSHLSTALTQTGVTFGTADYISPEQAKGQQATPRSDLYSLGVTCYEMLTGHLPFTADTALAVAMQHVGTEPPSPRLFNAQIPPQLEALVLRVLAKDPALRPGSAQELAQLLQNYRSQADQQTVATPINPAGGPFLVARSNPPNPPQAWPRSPSATSTGRKTMPPPPRSPIARVSQGQGLGCGGFVVGFLVLISVLGLVMIVANNIIANIPGPKAVQQTTAIPPISTATLVPTALPKPSSEPTLTPWLRPTLRGVPSAIPTEELPTWTPTAELPSPTHVALVSVPSIVNLPKSEALQALDQAGLIPVEGTPRYDNVVPKGLVAEQRVPGGSQLAKGQAVYFIVSLGPDLVIIPNWQNKAIGDVRTEATRLGLRLAEQEVGDRAISKDFVVKQDLNPGAKVKPGSSIVLQVSIGDQIRFPKLIGRTQDEAEKIIKDSKGDLVLVFVDIQGADRLKDFAKYGPNEVVSATANDQPVYTDKWVQRGSQIVLGVRADDPQNPVNDPKVDNPQKPKKEKP